MHSWRKSDLPAQEWDRYWTSPTVENLPADGASFTRISRWSFGANHQQCCRIRAGELRGRSLYHRTRKLHRRKWRQV